MIIKSATKYFGYKYKDIGENIYINSLGGIFMSKTPLKKIIKSKIKTNKELTLKKKCVKRLNTKLQRS